MPSQNTTSQSVRLIEHEVMPDSGSFEVRFTNGRHSRYFYRDDLPSRRLRPEVQTREAALKDAREFARAARDDLEAVDP